MRPHSPFPIYHSPITIPRFPVPAHYVYLLSQHQLIMLKKNTCLHCFLVFILFFSCFSQLKAQAPDSVQVEGTWFYVYPIEKEVNSDPQYKKLSKLTDDGYDLYLDWLRTGDPRANGTFHDIKKETKQYYSPERNLFERKFYNSGQFVYGYNAVRKIKKAYKDTLELQVDVHYSLDEDIIPFPGDLPDGKYVQYYEPFTPINKKGKLDFQDQRMALFFELKDNALHNDFLMLSYYGDTIKSGKFENGIKAGDWVFTPRREIEVMDPKKSLPIVYTTKTYRFRIENGKLNGSYESFEDGLPVISGWFTDNAQTGTWKESKAYRKEKYARDRLLPYPDFTLRYDLRPMTELLLTDSLAIIRRAQMHLPDPGVEEFEWGPYYKQFEYYPVNHIDVEDYKRIAARQGLNLPVISPGMKESFNIVREAPNLLRYFTFSTFKEARYPNGQLLYRMERIPGKSFVEPVIYYDNGKVCDSIAYDPAAGKYTQLIFDYTGKLYSIETFDKKGESMKREFPWKAAEKPLVIDGLEVKAIWGGFSYYKWVDPEEKWTERVLTYKKWDSDTFLLQEQWYDPANGTYTTTINNFYGRPYSTGRYKESAEKLVNHEIVIAIDSLELVASSTYKKPAYRFITYENEFIYSNGDPDSVFFMLKWKGENYTGPIDFKWTDHTVAIDDKKGLVVSLPEYKDYRRIEKLKRKRARNPSYTASFMNLPAQDGNALDVGKALRQMLFSTTSLARLEQGSYLSFAHTQSFKGQFKNGKPDGEWRFLDNKDQLRYVITYSEGVIEGKIETWDVAHPRKHAYEAEHPVYYWQRYDQDGYVRNEAGMVPPEKEVLYLQKLSAYKKGALNGPEYEFGWNGDTIVRRYYVNNLLNGKAASKTLFDKIEGSFVNDKLEGLFTADRIIYVPVTVEKEITGFTTKEVRHFGFGFRNDTLNGISTLYQNGIPEKTIGFSNGKIATGYTEFDKYGRMLVEGVFTDSNLTGLNYYIDGLPDYSITALDSLEIHIDHGFENTCYRYKYELMNEEDPNYDYYREELWFEKEETGPFDNFGEIWFRKYGQDKEIIREGTVLLSKKTGRWKFNDYAGQHLYTINYFDTVLTVNDSVKLNAIGKVEGTSRYVTEEIEKYDCTHSDYYPIRQYAVIGNAPDSVYERWQYDNGTIQGEGNLINGLPEGVWKFYMPDGKLHMVGKYLSGKRQGRWLIGDLSKQKYMGEICLDPDTPDIDKEIEYMQNDLDIQLYYYDAGIVQNYEYYNWNRNKTKQVSKETD